MRNFERVVSVGIVVSFAMTLLAIGGIVWGVLNPEMVAGRLGAAVKAFMEAAR